MESVVWVWGHCRPPKTLSPIFGDSKSSGLRDDTGVKNLTPSWTLSHMDVLKVWFFIGWKSINPEDWVSTDRSVRNFFSYSANMQTRCQDFRFHRCATVTRVALDLGPLPSPVAIFKQQPPVRGRWLASPVAIFSSMHPILGGGWLTAIVDISSPTRYYLHWPGTAFAGHVVTAFFLHNSEARSSGL